MLSKKASCNTHGQDSSYFKGWQEYDKNPYHELHNPAGIIQMGLAENQLSFDLLEAWLADNPEAPCFKKNGRSVFRELALYQDYNGLPAFKKVLADTMAETRGNRMQFDPNNIVLTAGSTSANETLMFCLAESGDAFLLPTPYYPGFDRDLKWRTGVSIIPIHCSSANGFRVTECALEDAYRRSQAQKLRVKGVLMTNPSNPLGTTASQQELDAIIAFVAAKQIHLISDEIYSGTVFDSDPPFISALEALKAKGLEGTPTWRRTHIVYSLSKDLGLPGFRCGAVYSNDAAVVDAATKMSSFGLVSSQTQFLLAAMLGDVTFRRRYVEENKKRLRGRRERLVSGLRESGIGCLGSNSGLFCWVDMRHLLKSPTFQAEMDLWERILGDVGLNISPGSSCHCGEPGWFRVCFANVSEYTLDLAVRRLKAFVEGTNGHAWNHSPAKRLLDFEEAGQCWSKRAGDENVLDFNLLLIQPNQNSTF